MINVTQVQINGNMANADDAGGALAQPVIEAVEISKNFHQQNTAWDVAANANSKNLLNLSAAQDVPVEQELEKNTNNVSIEFKCDSAMKMCEKVMDKISIGIMGDDANKAIQTLLDKIIILNSSCDDAAKTIKALSDTVASDDTDKAIQMLLDRLAAMNGNRSNAKKTLKAPPDRIEPTDGDSSVAAKAALPDTIAACDEQIGKLQNSILTKYGDVQGHIIIQTAQQMANKIIIEPHDVPVKIVEIPDATQSTEQGYCDRLKQILEVIKTGFEGVMAAHVDVENRWKMLEATLHGNTPANGTAGNSTKCGSDAPHSPDNEIFDPRTRAIAESNGDFSSGENTHIKIKCEQIRLDFKNIKSYSTSTAALLQEAISNDSQNSRQTLEAAAPEVALNIKLLSGKVLNSLQTRAELMDMIFDNHFDADYILKIAVQTRIIADRKLKNLLTELAECPDKDEWMKEKRDTLRSAYEKSLSAYRNEARAYDCILLRSPNDEKAVKFGLAAINNARGCEIAKKLTCDDDYWKIEIIHEYDFEDLWLHNDFYGACDPYEKCPQYWDL
jgi:hypothetical protein